jgi:hypothetical protein
MIEDLFDTIDNDTGEVLSRAVKKLGKRMTVNEAQEAMLDRRIDVAVMLDPDNAYIPSDGFPNMVQRVREVKRMTPKNRALTAIMHRDTPPAGLTTNERRNWLDGLNQIGG